MEHHRIHVFGASGSGTTTLGRAVATSASIPHFDADDFYWEPTDPPYRVKHDPLERVRLLGEALDEAGRAWILTGSLCGWGDPLVPRFDLAVFLSLTPAVRLLRLRERELERYGAERLASDEMAAAHDSFMTWAAQYDVAGPELRSRVLHERWITTLPCPVLRLDSEADIESLSAEVLRAMRDQAA